jgi:bifunctional UDP-N-acetylglucosamine pyrophosphorylase/glucosamine-1-phosphate N-acetyltransferase
LNLTILVLAAGQGTRMRSDLPKVLHPLAGRPMVRYVLDVARSLEPAHLVAVVGYGADLVRQVLGAEIETVVQAELLGTAHALRQAAAAAGRADTVLVLYGDTPLVRAETLRRAVEHHLGTGSTVTILTFRPEDPAGYGRIVRDPATGQVLRIVEEKDATAEQRAIGEVNSGVFCLRDGWLWPNLPSLKQRPGGEYYLTDLVEVACGQRQRVEAVCVPDPAELAGLDNRVKLAQAEAEMRRRINERWMLAGVTFVDPAATYVEAGVEIGADTMLWPGCCLQGKTRIGQGCLIGPGAVIRDSIVGDRCRVQLSVLEGAAMDEGSDVGPYSHLRKGARVGAGAHVGNFGEIKNSELGPGAKMGHFSYLGDATIGARANIGAGTITCNYDGQAKYPTVVGAGAFIGSDTMLVAPVTVGEGARTGAGAVVTRDVPPHAVAYGVPARVRPEPEAADSEGEAV